MTSSISAPDGAMLSIQRDDAALVLQWANGATVRFVLKGNELLGARDVTFDGLPLRNPARLWRPIFITPHGVHYHRFELRDIREADNGGVAIELDAVGSASGLNEELDEYLGDVIDLSHPDTEVRDRLTWELRPSAHTVGEHTFIGFAYRYRFETDEPSRQLYRVFDHATWEVGGKLDGNELLLQGQCNPPATSLSDDGSFTTACNYYGAEMQGLTGVPSRVSFQRLPRIGTLQAFDSIAHDAGMLLGLFEPMEEVFSVVQTLPGETCLHVMDEYRQPCAPSVVTPWKHMLFLSAPAQWDRAARRNVWHKVYEQAHGAIRAVAGVERSHVHPRQWLPQFGQDTFIFNDKEHPRDRFLYLYADEVLPRWADMGVREICSFSLWQTDYTIDRLKTKQGSGNPLHGALIVGSICNVHSHEIDSLWGGPDALAYFTDKAHQLDMKVQMWWASHMSRRAPIFQQRPDFMMNARDGLPNGGGFGHQIIISLDLNNEECFEYIYNQLKAVYEATGIDGLFHDSYGNMTFLPTNFDDPQRRGQQQAFARLLNRLQALGMDSFTIEGIGPFGVGHFGMNLLASDPAEQKGYQNALDWWVGEEDMMYGLNMGCGPAPIWPGREEQARVFSFRCIANGGRFGFSHTGGGPWRDWWREHNQMMARLGPVFGQRQLLPEDQGVLWHMDQRQVLFAFKPIKFDVDPNIRVSEVTADGPNEITVTDGVLRAHAWKVYQLQKV